MTPQTLTPEQHAKAEFVSCGQRQLDRPGDAAQFERGEDHETLLLLTIRGPDRSLIVDRRFTGDRGQP